MYEMYDSTHLYELTEKKDDFKALKVAEGRNN